MTLQEVQLNLFPEEPNLAGFVDIRNSRPLLRYFQHVFRKHSTLNNLGLALDDDDRSVRSGGPAPLNNLYVPLMLSPRHLRPADMLDAEREEQPLMLITIADALKANRWLAVLGDPGSGKSTLVAQLMVALTQGGDTHLKAAVGEVVPFALVLREMRLANLRSWDDLWSAYLDADPERAAILSGRQNSVQTTIPFEPASLIRSLFESGQAMVVLDGFDEVKESERDAVRAAMVDGLQRFPACRWIVTSRLVNSLKAGRQAVIAEDQSYDTGGFVASATNGELANDVPPKRFKWLHELRRFHGAFARELGKGSASLYVVPFRREDIERFVRNWFAEYVPDRSQQKQRIDELLARLPGNEYIDALARVPVLLNLICFIHARRGRLPDGRAELYERISLTYLSTLDRARGLQFPGQGFEYADYCRWLARLAYQMQASGDRRILVSETEVLEVLKDGVRELDLVAVDEQASFVLDYLTQRAGLLVPRGEFGGPRQYGFTHLSLQEYFLARYLAEMVTAPGFEQANDSHFSWKYLNALTTERSWHEAFLLMFEVLPGRWPAHALIKMFDIVAARPDNAKPEAAEWLRYLLLAEVTMDSSIRLPKADRTSWLGRLWTAVLQRKVSDAEWYFHDNDTRGLVMERLWSPKHGSLECFRGYGSRCTSLHFFGASVSELSALHDLPLRRLHLSASRVTNLAVMRSLEKLQRLHLGNTAVSDVSPLANLALLRHLDLGNTAVSDVSPLANLALLRNLYLGNTAVSDVSPLANLALLRHLDLENTGVGDVTPLAGLGLLQEICLRDTRIDDVSALAGLLLIWYLDLDHTLISDVSPLAGLSRLRHLDLGYTLVDDASALAGLTQLRHLDLGNTEVTDVSALAGLTQLRRLDLGNTEVTDVSALAGLTQLRHLDLGNTEVTDVSALAGLTQLRRLDLANTGVTDVSALAGLKRLRTLKLFNTPVTDVSMLPNVRVVR